MHLEELLSTSRATTAFKSDALAYDLGQDVPRITTARRAPRIKVLRVVAQIASAHPDLEIDSIHVDGWSGCSDFRGHVDVRTARGTRTFTFHWDCHWRAMTEGWLDAFGFPDQIRAAREFSWRCFAEWREKN